MEKHTKKNQTPTLMISPDSGRDGVLVKKSKLLIINGTLQGEEFMIDKDIFTIGSGPHNDLVLQDSTVSRRHCELQLMSDGYSIRDFGSTNGTLINGVRVTEAFLNQGTQVQLGNTKVVFCPVQQTRMFEFSQKEEFGSLLGKSIPMRRVFHLAERYAPTDATMLVEGETGTGKEVLAEEIHRHSPRKNKPFIIIDCASLAKDIIESELFGHTKGAFTGATSDRTGAFEHADGGTVFLDEIGNLSPELQPKLLRVIEKKEVKRIGMNRLTSINVRIISATNRKLESEVNAGRFREDLYFRLSVVHIELPPLRLRKEDIPMLTMKFLREFHGDKALDHVVNFKKTMDAFANYDWPGNVRELRNLIEMACYGAPGPVDLSTFLYLNKTKAGENRIGQEFGTDRPFKIVKGKVIAEFEKNYIQDILTRNEGNISKASREAGIERAYLQRLIKKHGLQA